MLLSHYIFAECVDYALVVLLLLLLSLLLISLLLPVVVFFEQFVRRSFTFLPRLIFLPLLVLREVFCCTRATLDVNGGAVHAKEEDDNDVNVAIE